MLLMTFVGRANGRLRPLCHRVGVGSVAIAPAAAAIARDIGTLGPIHPPFAPTQASVNSLLPKFVGLLDRRLPMTIASATHAR